MRINTNIFTPKHLAYYGLGASLYGLFQASKSSQTQSIINTTTQSKLSTLEKKTELLIDKISENTAETKMSNTVLDFIKERLGIKLDQLSVHFDKVNQSTLELKKVLDILKDTSIPLEEKLNKINEILPNINEHIDNLEEFHNNLDTLNKTIELFNTKNGSNFIDSIYEFMKSFDHFIGSLDLIHQLTIVHMFACICLIFSLFSLIAILYGDYLIRRFDLETKYPKLAKWIQLRRKLQNYSLIWNFILIFSVIIVIFIVNIWLFIIL